MNASVVLNRSFDSLPLVAVPIIASSLIAGDPENEIRREREREKNY